MELKKIHSTKKREPKQKKNTLEGIFYINFDKFSEKQKKMFHNLYLEYIRDGLNSKEAMDKASRMVNCFKI
jgi:hypothetical protein